MTLSNFESMLRAFSELIKLPLIEQILFGFKTKNRLTRRMLMAVGIYNGKDIKNG